MDSSGESLIKQKNLLPSPKFQAKKIPSPKFSKFENILATKQNQISSTIPAKYLEKYKSHIEKYNLKFKEKYNNAIKNDVSQKLWCENCDSSFYNQELLNKHNKDYKSCTLDGCSFKSCSKSLTKHITEVHSTGLYEKIKNLNTPEEIAKWREDRRKRYPTILNVQLRQKAQEERRKRGELLENNKSRFGSRNDRNKMNSGVKNNIRRQNDFDQHKTKNVREKRPYINNANKKVNKVAKLTVPESDICLGFSDDDEFKKNNLLKFRGTSSIPNYQQKEVCKKTQINALTGFLGMYGDSSDSEKSSESENEFINEKEMEFDQNMDSFKDCSSSLQKQSKDIFKCEKNSICQENDTCFTEPASNFENGFRVLNSQKQDNSTTDIRQNLETYFHKENRNETHDKQLFHQTSLKSRLKLDTEPQAIKNCENEQNDIPDEQSILRRRISILKDSFALENTLDIREEGEEKNEMPDEQPILRTEISIIKDSFALENTLGITEEEKKEEMPDEQPILRTEISMYKNNSTSTKVEEINNYSHVNERNSSKTVGKEFKIRSKVRQTGSLLDYSKLRKTNQNTLLEKLLEPHIRHERNVLLQCVRYVVDNKFFGIGQASTANT